MFRKVLVANRGEVAVRVVRACHDLGVPALAVFEPEDRGALHVRLAAECVALEGDGGYSDGGQLLRVAVAHGCDAVLPGWGFLAENARFARAAAAAGVAFVGPPAELIALQQDRPRMLDMVLRAGHAVPAHSGRAFRDGEEDEIARAAGALGFPLVVKSIVGGRGRGARIARNAASLEAAVETARAEAQIVYGDRRVYLEQALAGARHVGVQLLGDARGRLLSLGEREGTIQRGNQKLVDEAPSSALTEETRALLVAAALDIGRLFRVRSACTVEFVLDREGKAHFTEIKPRIQREHVVTELVTGVDLVSWQLKIAAGQPLDLDERDVVPRGVALSCRVNAEDPWRGFLPTPGRVEKVRLPGGPGVRVDTYVFAGAEIGGRYDPSVAQVAVRGESRAEAVERLRRALQEFTLIGPPTNVPLQIRIVGDPLFAAGRYDHDFFSGEFLEGGGDERHRRDLAVAAALAYGARHLAFRPEIPERFMGGWHREGRRLPS